MRSFRTKNRVKDWAEIAAKIAVLFTEPKVRAAASNQVHDQVQHVTDVIASKYADAVDHLEAAGAALKRRNYFWQERTMGFLLGVGIGAGLGILLAPASGGETRAAIRDKTVDMKNKVADSTTTATRKMRESLATMPSTGTEG